MQRLQAPPAAVCSQNVNIAVTVLGLAWQVSWTVQPLIVYQHVQLSLNLNI